MSSQPPPQYQPSHTERLMAKARAQVELEQIHRDAVDGDLISFEGKAQFRIRDIMLLTTLTAIVMMFSRYFGGRSIFVGILLCAFAWGWYYAATHRRAHDNEIARRLRELAKKHDEEHVKELPIKAVMERTRE